MRRSAPRGLVCLTTKLVSPTPSLLGFAMMQAARRINLDKDNHNSNGLLEQGEAR